MELENREEARAGRSRNGQWLPGVSGNRHGRPRQRAERPKSVNEEIAAAWHEKRPVKDACGKQRMVSRQTAFVQRLMDSLLDLPPDKAIRVIEQLHKLQALGIGEEQRSEASRMTSEERTQLVGEIIRDALEQRNEERDRQLKRAADSYLGGAPGPSPSSTAGGASAGETAS